jgi:biopolymer transport protein ExbB
MTRIFHTFLAGGLVMWPLLGLSIATIGTVSERGWFWFKLIMKEKKLVEAVLTAAKEDLGKAGSIANESQNLAIGRLLLAPLKLRRPSPETFHMALKAASDKEIMEMRRGDRLLEAVMAIAPLLGILGTAGGLITTYGNLQGADADANRAFLVGKGIGEALISSASGISLAIVALVSYRIFLNLQSSQIDYFTKVANEFELIYLQFWHDPTRVTPMKLLAPGKDND